MFTEKQVLVKKKKVFTRERKHSFAITSLCRKMKWNHIASPVKEKVPGVPVSKIIHPGGLFNRMWKDSLLLISSDKEHLYTVLPNVYSLGYIYIYIYIYQAAVLTILLYGCTTWTLTKRMEKKLNGSCRRMLRVVLIKYWMQYTTKRQLYGHLSPISKTIMLDEQDMQDTAGVVRTNS